VPQRAAPEQGIDDSRPAPANRVSATPHEARWRALVAGFLGWMLDGYDYTMLTLVLIDIQRDLNAGSAAAGALGTVTLLTRLVGGVAAGYAADRFGRKLPMLVSILWFSIFAFLSGFSTSYAMLFGLRALFGLGMGGEWAAGTPLVLEHWPERHRGVVSGVLQGAFSWGFILAALVFHYVYPLLADMPSLGWRAMLWTGILPALLVLWIRRSVPESPAWLTRRSESEQAASSSSIGWRELLRRAWRPCLVLGALMFSYQSMTFWYATMLRQQGLAPLLYLIALNAGGILGAAAWGSVVDTRLGRRGAIALAVAASLAIVPAFLFATSPITLIVAALAMGLTGAGVIGISPAYLTATFPTSSRGRGSGIAYHVAAAIGALAPYLLGELQDVGWSVRAAMAASIVVAGLLALLSIYGDRSQPANT
jgi:SHS family lactate transporter-like MFS transporter